MCYFKSTLRPLGKPVKWTKIITFDDHFQFFNLTAYKIYEKNSILQTEGLMQCGVVCLLMLRKSGLEDFKNTQVNTQ